MPIFSSDNSTQQEQLCCPLIDLIDFTINTNGSNYSEIELNKKITNNKKTQENTQSEEEKEILENIFKVEAQIAKGAKQILAQHERERQAREKRQQEKNNKKKNNKKKNNKKKNNKKKTTRKKQQWLTE